MNVSDLTALSIAELQALLRRREASPREALEALQARITEMEPRIDAYLSIDFDDALRQAERADVNLPLGGVPIAIKDIISVAGQPCTCASRILRNYRAPYDATVIRKLRGAGAIPFGKTNMDEFAMGASTENSSVKLTRNPWDVSRVPGGSSGGSAAAVASDVPTLAVAAPAKAMPRPSKARRSSRPLPAIGSSGGDALRSLRRLRVSMALSLSGWSASVAPLCPDIFLKVAVTILLPCKPALNRVFSRAELTQRK